MSDFDNPTAGEPRDDADRTAAPQSGPAADAAATEGARAKEEEDGKTMTETAETVTAETETAPAPDAPDATEATPDAPEMTEATPDTTGNAPEAETEEFDDPPFPEINPIELASKVALLTADDISQVNDFISATDMGDGTTDFRFQAAVPGYEGWQWSVTLYHDEERGTWTVCESSLLPTADALLPPPWVPWKDRLEPTDLSPTDSIGTDENDPRLEDGFRSEATHAHMPGSPETKETAEEKTAGGEDKETGEDSAQADGHAEPTSEAGEEGEADRAAALAADERKEAEEIAEAFNLTRRRVLSPLGRSQAAERWYDGPRGPKALSTQTAGGKICQTCGFYVGIQGDLGRMFGVCANKWSPDDGKVVSGDHGCGEHSEIAPPAPTPMWIQTEPALDDNTIEIVRRARREESPEVERMEEAYGRPDDADEADIDANVVPADEDDEEPEGESDHTHEIQYEESLDVSVEDDGADA